ncbi:MAG: class I SAM-dependent methyltransferase [Planctomycetales bacterium]|nr:class I SAM-dependent methyltransferase [bacterium]UNM08885.1 MAG: class I SAM-dependent methyltransferase [Planctomycetales bacterium]
MDQPAVSLFGQKLQPSLEQLHRYWIENYRQPGTGDAAVRNSAMMLERMIDKLGCHDPYVLEIGCAAGHNLQHLQALGMHRLSGIEINPDAVARLQQDLPELFAEARIYNLPVEDVMGLFGDGEFDVVCSVNVLSHIHPDSEWVFSELARVATSGLVLVEDEHSRSMWDFPRNYRRIFEGFGMAQLHEEACPAKDGAAESMLRVFSRQVAR